MSHGGLSVWLLKDHVGSACFFCSLWAVCPWRPSSFCAQGPDRLSEGADTERCPEDAAPSLVAGDGHEEVCPFADLLTCPVPARPPPPPLTS